jgi:hypothetical protein
MSKSPALGNTTFIDLISISTYYTRHAENHLTNIKFHTHRHHACQALRH